MATRDDTPPKPPRGGGGRTTPRRTPKESTPPSPAPGGKGYQGNYPPKGSSYTAPPPRASGDKTDHNLNEKFGQGSTDYSRNNLRGRKDKIGTPGINGKGSTPLPKIKRFGADSGERSDRFAFEKNKGSMDDFTRKLNEDYLNKTYNKPVSNPRSQALLNTLKKRAV